MTRVQKMGMLIKGIINYTPSEAFELCRDGAWILDVREDLKYRQPCRWNIRMGERESACKYRYRGKAHWLLHVSA